MFASLIGQPSSSVVNRYLLQIGATNAGEWRRIITFAPLTGTVTVNRAFTAQTATAEASELHVIPPGLYTKAGNEAIYKVRDMIYREVDSFLLPDNTDDWYHFPRGMRTLNHIYRVGSQTIKDLFDRADSTTNPGTGWVATTGTWGVISERLYAQTDANGDFLTRKIDLRDGYIRATVRGTPNHATVYRIPVLAFRIREDYLKAVDTTTCLLVRLQNAVVDLRKNDGGTETSLATATQTTTNGVDYIIEVLFIGSRIRIWVDGVELISYELLGTDLKYTSYPQVGVRWDKGGAPATAARLDDYYAYLVNRTVPFVDYEVQPNSLTLRIPAAGHGYPWEGELLMVLGQAKLTEMAADTTFETIAADTTAVLEITTGDPAYQLLLDHARYILYEHAAQPGNIADAEERAEYARQAKIAKEAIDTRLEMPQPTAMFHFPS